MDLAGHHTEINAIVGDGIGSPRRFYYLRGAAPLRTLLPSLADRRSAPYAVNTQPCMHQDPLSSRQGFYRSSLLIYFICRAFVDL